MAATAKKYPFPAHVRLVRDRNTYPKLDTMAKIRSAGDTEKIMREIMDDELQEVFVGLWLNNRSRVISHTVITRGLVDSCLVHTREVFRHAIAAGAVGIIIGHNHPSGDPTPSAEDKAITRMLVESGKILDIPVYDHIIIGEIGRYTSFATAGLL